MKKLILSALLAVCALCTAAQNLWDAAQTSSPQINDDNSVTFRLHAPKAVKVLVTGDFLPDSTAELTENENGIWSFTTPPLAPELYSYAFIVDGLKILDPANVYVNRDVATLANIFLIEGGQADLYKVNDVPHGSLTRTWYHSPSLGTSRRMTVYTPPGYESGKLRYPVLYLLHGMGNDEEGWPALGRAARIMDNLIASGKAQPMIVVMTNGNVAQQAAPGEAPEGMVRPSFNLPHTMDGTFEASFPEIVARIDDCYRTLRDKHHRAIAGLSMGGFHAMQISKEYPDMFDYVGLFSAAVRAGYESRSRIYDNWQQKVRLQFKKRPALYWIAIGKDDFLYQANVEYRKWLDDNNLPYIYRESDGGHEWRNWRIYLSEFAPMLFRSKGATE